MREIKFRAWEPAARKMHNPEKIDCLADEPLFLGFDGAIRQICDAAYRGSECGHYIKDQPSFVAMQFTGLKDEKGIEIFEGDVVSCIVQAAHGRPETYVRGPVEFTSYGVSFASFGAEYCHDVRVIGNIHQNPELLKVA